MPRLRYRVSMDAREADRGARVAERAMERVEQQSRETARAVRRFGDDLDRAGREAGTAARGFRGVHTALAGIATGAVAVGLQRVIANAAELGDSLTNLSRATDLSVEALQTYGEAFRQGGASQAQYEAGVARLGLSLSQARRGTLLQAAALRELNVTDLTDVEGALRRIFETVDADSFQRLRPVLRQVFGDDSVRVFGSTLQRSVEDVDRIRERVGALGTEGAAALSSVASEASELSAILRTELAEAVAANADSIRDLLGQLAALARGISEFLTPPDPGAAFSPFTRGLLTVEARARLAERAIADMNDELFQGPRLETAPEAAAGLDAVGTAAGEATPKVDRAGRIARQSAVGFGLLAGETQRVRRNLADVAAEIAGGFEVPEVEVFRSVDALGELGEAAAEVDREFSTASRAVESHMRRIVDSIADGTATAGDLLRTLTAALLNVGVDLLGRRVATGSFSATPTAASAGRTLANAQASQRAQPIQLHVENQWTVNAIDGESLERALERGRSTIEGITEAGVMRGLQQATPLRAAVRAVR